MRSQLFSWFSTGIEVYLRAPVPLVLGTLSLVTVDSCLRLAPTLPHLWGFVIQSLFTLCLEGSVFFGTVYLAVCIHGGTSWQEALSKTDFKVSRAVLTTLLLAFPAIVAVAWFALVLTRYRDLLALSYGTLLGKPFYIGAGGSFTAISPLVALILIAVIVGGLLGSFALIGRLAFAPLFAGLGKCSAVESITSSWRGTATMVPGVATICCLWIALAYTDMLISRPLFWDAGNVSYMAVGYLLLSLVLFKPVLFGATGYVFVQVRGNVTNGALEMVDDGR